MSYSDLPSQTVKDELELVRGNSRTFMQGRERLRYGFGRFKIDTPARVLFAAGEPVKIAPRSVETLRVLVENASVAPTKEELLSRIRQPSISLVKWHIHEAFTENSLAPPRLADSVGES